MALISDPGQWIYIHIPKNGGAAVDDYLTGHGVVTWRVMERIPVDREVFPPHIRKHSPARAYRDWMQSTGRDWSAYLSFATVRDPDERPQSVLEEIRASHGVRDDPDQYWTLAGPEWWSAFDTVRDPDDFVLSGLFDPDGPLPITHTQWSYVSDGPDRIVDHLIPLRRMSSEIPRLLGLPGTIPVFHKREYVPAGLSSEAVARLRDRYRIDYDLVRQAERSWGVAA
jgi:hypothetical protein